MTPFLKYLFDILDGWAYDQTPFGIAQPNGSTGLTSVAFDHYLATYGVPKTANQARHMFEWASALETAHVLLLDVSEKES